MTEVNPEINSFIDAVSTETAIKWRESYKRRVNIEVEEVSKKIVALLAKEFVEEEWGFRSQKQIAEKAGVANEKQVAKCVGHLWNTLHESDYELAGSPMMYRYEDNRLHKK